MTDLETFRLIGSISRRATRSVNQEVKQYGLDNNLFLYLLRICEQPGMTQHELIQLVQVDKTTMSRALNKLEKLGLVTKKTDPANKNYKLLFPTAAGRKIEPKIANLEADCVQQSFEGLSQNDRKQLTSILKTMQGSLSTGDE